MKNITKNSPEDLIPDDVNYYVKDGIQIRKGTMSSAICNAGILESAQSTLEEKNMAREILEELAPALCAFGLNKHFVWKNPAIQSIFDNAMKRNKL